MINTISANASFGMFDPLQGYANLQKVNGQIQTNNFEQVHVRSVTSTEQQSGEQAVGSADSAERGRLLESLRYRLDRPLVETSVLEKVGPAQAAASFQRMSDFLVSEFRARDPANQVKSISVFA